MTHVVVTGGAGFVGSHLIDALLARGDRVTAVDNFITGHHRNVAHLIDRGDFHLVEQDVSEGLDVEGPVDAVLHFASPASPVDYFKYPIETLLVGSAGTVNSLELARANGAIYMLASTSEVYGDPEVTPQPESYWGRVNPIGERSCYDESKRFAEAMTMAYRKIHGVQTKIVRLFNTYGPRMRLNDGRVIPAFVDAVERGEPLPVHGDGSQTRTFSYVDDTVRGVLAVLDHGDHMPYNVGGEGEMTILDFAHTLIDVCGTSSHVTYADPNPDDPKRREPDLTRLRALGWAPRTSLREGLERTVEWFRSGAAASAQP